MQKGKKHMNNIRKMIVSALFMALGVILPFFTGQIPQVGSMLLPMHLPVLLCGFLCGWRYGMLVGFFTPLLRSAMFGMPPMMPTAAAMAFELATYGAVSGLLGRSSILRRSRKLGEAGIVYVSLIGAMLAGRVVWGAVSIPLYGAVGSSFTLSIFLTGAFVGAVPGILLQLLLIPVLLLALKRSGAAQWLESDERIREKQGNKQGAACQRKE